MTAKLIDVVYSPEHWNQNCGSMIPEAWEALVDTGDGVCRVFGHTRDEALTSAGTEFPEIQ
jgi:hypothetical protein